MKLETWIVLGQTALVAGVAWFGYKEYQKWFGGANGGIVGQAATSAGYDVAVSATSPQLEYDQARQDYAKSLGMTGDLSSPPNWPDNNNWIYYGAGPDGFTYGSAKYPKAPTPSLTESAFAWISGAN